MVQGRGGPRLKQKSIEGILIARELRRQELQRDFAPQIEVLRLINHSHATTPELSGNAVMRNGLADH
jgi:hypothetical protein